LDFSIEIIKKKVNIAFIFFFKNVNLVNFNINEVFSNKKYNKKRVRIE